MEIKYFDHAATTPVKKEVREEMMPYWSEKYGNPSSVHQKGLEAKEAIVLARKRVAEALHAQEDEIYFTSGGTEADNLAIKGFARANKQKGRHIITSCIEHKAVLESCKTLEEEGFSVTYVPVDSYGRVDPKEIEKAIQSDTILISIMFANNEIGTIEPIEAIGKIAEKHQITFHTDAVQAVGNVEINLATLPVDMLSLSGHKLSGPKGVGVLYVKRGVSFYPLFDGGGQERNKRGGTENVAGIVGLGKAMELATQHLQEHRQTLLQLKDFLKREMRATGTPFFINGHPTECLPGTINITIPGVDAESLLLLLSEKGFCISTASACSSHSKHTSHVLKAIGLTEEEAKSTIRITIGEENRKKDVKELVEWIHTLIQKLQEME